MNLSSSLKVKLCKNNESYYSNRIFLNNGRILMIDIENGKTESIFKISSDKISKPFINKNYMFVVKDNEIIKLD